MDQKEKERKPRNWRSFPGTPEERASNALSRLEDITRLVSEIIWETDEQELLTYVSPRANQIIEILPEQMVGKKLSDLGIFFSADNEEKEPNWGKPFRDHLFKIKDGKGNEKTLLVSGLPHFDKETWQLRGFYGTAVDITESLETERERDFQRFALDEHAIVSIADIQGNITYANDRFCAVSGYSRDELIGQNHRLLKSDEHSPAFYRDLWQTITNGKTWSGEIKNHKKDGGIYWVNATIVPFTNEQGKPFQYVAIRTDITERMIAKEMADTANRAKSELLANMSHELRTPLNAIIGFSESMKEETFGPVGSDKNREYLDDIHQSGQHLLKLINDILDVSAVEAGALELQEENVNLTDVVETSVRIIRPRADNGQVSVTSHIDPDIPLIYADARRVEQVFLNLLSNAVKFTLEGGEVTVSAQLDNDGSLAIAVADTGIGMDEEGMTKALSTFGQVDSGLNRKHEGSGLGLPLTKGLMELHGGTFEIESEKGHGSLITVTFPKERVIQKV